LGPMRLPTLTEGGLSRNIWRLGLPTMASSALLTVFSVIDMIFVGRLGPAAVAAVGLSGTILMLAYTFGIGIYAGTVAVVSRSIGAGDQREAEHAAMQALLLALVLGVGMVVAFYPLAPTAIRALGGKPDVVSQGTAYLRISALGSLVFFSSIALYSVLRGAGDAVTPLIINLISVVANIILDPIMIFGLAGFPPLGVAGSALATVCARGLGTLILFYIMFRGKHQIHLRAKELRPDTTMMWRLVRIGVFGSAEMLIRNVSMLILARVVAGFGTEAMAGYAIVLRLRGLVIMPAMGLGGSAGTLVGQNLGAGKPRRAELSGWLAAGYYAMVSAAMGVVLWTAREPIVRVFNSDPRVVQVGADFALYSAVALFFIGTSIVLNRAMNGAGDTLSPMVITLLTVLGGRLPLAVGLAWWLHSVTGVWMGATAASVLQTLIVCAWFGRGGWKRKRV